MNDTPIRRIRSMKTAGLILAAVLGVPAAHAQGDAAAAQAPADTHPANLAQADASLQDVLARGQALMRQGRAAEAYALLAPLEARHAGEPGYDYLLGIAATDAGHPSRAIFALERLVATQPGNSLAHAELARAYLAAGEKDAARRELHEARRGTMPPEAARAIDRVLGAIEEPAEPQARRMVRGYLDIGLGYDTNLNSATANGQFALPAFGGIVFTLDPASRRRAGSYMMAGAGSDFQLGLSGPFSLVGSVNARQTFNEGNHDLQQRQGDASVGLAWSGGADTVTASLQSSTFWLDTDRYRSANGVSAQWQHALPDAAQASGFAQWSRLSYPGQDARNADRVVVGAGYAKAWGSGEGEGSAPLTVLYGSLYGANEQARASDVDNYSHHALGARAGFERRSGRLTWFGALQYESRRYGGPEPFFLTMRRDRQTDLLLGLRYEIAPGWRLMPQIVRTRAASNVTLYDYRRTVYQLVLRREFN